MKHLLALTLFISSSVFAAGDEGLVRSENISNCSYWTYNGTINAYVCQSYPFTTQVAEAFSTQQAILDLEERVSELEAKLKAQTRTDR